MRWACRCTCAATPRSEGSPTDVPTPLPPAAHRIRAAFGALLDALLDESPARTAWLELDRGEVDAAFARARERLEEPGHALGFRTLLKQELDARCHVEAVPMSFEAPTLPPDRRWRTREARRDERARERERIEQVRRDRLREQAAELLRRPED